MEWRDEKQRLLEQLAALTGQHQSELDGHRQITSYELREKKRAGRTDKHTFTNITPVFNSSLLGKYEKQSFFVCFLLEVITDHVCNLPQLMWCGLLFDA